MTQPTQDQAVRELRHLLEQFTLEIGRQVTDEYTLKHGLWEGLSVNNVVTINKYEKLFYTICQKAEREVEDVFKLALAMGADGEQSKRVLSFYEELKVTPPQDTKQEKD